MPEPKPRPTSEDRVRAALGSGVCPASGCERGVRSGGYCMIHYLRLRRRGSTDDLPVRTPEERFWAKVDRSGTCWLWTGAHHESGYGRFWDNIKLVPAHRWSYEALVGPIPHGLQLDHLCRIPGCVNPLHLEPVTALENSRRAPATRAKIEREHCVHGHPFTLANIHVTPNGTRHCRQCNRDRSAQSRLIASVSAP